MSKDLEQLRESFKPVIDGVDQMAREHARSGNFDPKEAVERYGPVALQILREIRRESSRGFMSMYNPNRPDWYREVFGHE